MQKEDLLKSLSKLEGELNKFKNAADIVSKNTEGSAEIQRELSSYIKKLEDIQKLFSQLCLEISEEHKEVSKKFLAETRTDLSAIQQDIEEQTERISSLQATNFSKLEAEFKQVEDAVTTNSQEIQNTLNAYLQSLKEIQQKSSEFSQEVEQRREVLVEKIIKETQAQLSTIQEQITEQARKFSQEQSNNFTKLEIDIKGAQEALSAGGAEMVKISKDALSQVESSLKELVARNEVLEEQQRAEFNSHIKELDQALMKFIELVNQSKETHQKTIEAQIQNLTSISEGLLRQMKVPQLEMEITSLKTEILELASKRNVESLGDKIESLSLQIRKLEEKVIEEIIKQGHQTEKKLLDLQQDASKSKFLFIILFIGLSAVSLFGMFCLR